MSDDSQLANGSNPLDLIVAGARLLTVVVGVVMILVGVVYAVQVFQSVGALLRDPAGLEAPVQRMEKIISAEKLEVTINGQPLALGGPVSLLLMFLWYVFWAWLPLAIIAAGSRLVSSAAQMRRSERKA
jgi:hypothetical protein